MAKSSFDLPIYLSAVPSLYLRMQLLSSFAWRIDTMIVQQCRALFKLLKLTPLALTLDGDADLRSVITEGAWTEQLFDEAGPDRQTPMQTLWTLASMRLAAHEAAADATMLVPWSNGQQRQYKLAEIEDLFVPTGSTEPKGESLLRMQMVAERSAAKLATDKDVKAYAKRFLDADIARFKGQQAGIQRATALQSDSLIALYSYTMAQIPDHIVADFTHLHTDVQRTLIDNTIGAADRALNTAKDQPREVPGPEFNHLMVCVDDLTDDLKKVLASPAFNGGVNPTIVRKAVAKQEPLPTKLPALVPAAVKTQHISDLDQRRAAAQAKAANRKPRGKKVEQQDLKKELSLADQSNDL